MKRILFILTISLMGMQQLYAQEIYVCRQVHVSFFSSAPVEDIQAATEKGVSALNSHTREIYFKIPIRSFDFPNGMMQEHFNENFLESAKYPYSTFKGKIISPVDLTKNGSYNATVEGNLSIHGITKKYKESGTVVVKDGLIKVNADFKVRLADHSISIPTILFKKIAEVVTVELHAKYLPE